VTQIEIRLPSGLEVRFDGDADAFERFAEFLGGDFHEFLAKLGRAAQRSVDPGDADTDAAEEATSDGGQALARARTVSLAA
jgi:hypothetical protein